MPRRPQAAAAAARSRDDCSWVRSEGAAAPRSPSSRSGSSRGFCGNIRSASPGTNTTRKLRPRACCGVPTNTRPKRRGGGSDSTRQQAVGEHASRLVQIDRADGRHRPKIGEHAEHVRRPPQHARRETREDVEPFAPGRSVRPTATALPRRVPRTRADAPVAPTCVAAPGQGRCRRPRRCSASLICRASSAALPASRRFQRAASRPMTAASTSNFSHRHGARSVPPTTSGSEDCDPGPWPPRHDRHRHRRLQPLPSEVQRADRRLRRAALPTFATVVGRGPLSGVVMRSVPAARLAYVRHLAEREVFGKPRRRKMLGGTRE